MHNRPNRQESAVPEMTPETENTAMLLALTTLRRILTDYVAVTSQHLGAVETLDLLGRIEHAAASRLGNFVIHHPADGADVARRAADIVDGAMTEVRAELEQITRQ